MTAPTTPMAAVMASLQELAAGIPGAHLVGDGAVPVLRVHTDTRSIELGDLFVALQGERFDANTLLHEAQRLGARAVLCRTGLPEALLPESLPRIEVPDTLLALGACAAAWRKRFTLPLIAVTGSNGKTTVTQMIASILQAWQPGGQALATRGNLNNAIGVPLTLLRLRPEHRCAVVELGMNHPGEIATLAAMARPTVALVNNAQREHLEFMHSVDAVARENGAVLHSLPRDGVAVFPADDVFAPVWRAMAEGRTAMRFSMQPGGAESVLACARATWKDDAWQVHAQGLHSALQYRLGIAGAHNVRNSLAAAACALAAGAPVTAVQEGLCAFSPVKGRSRALLLRVEGQARTLVDDTYNANPDSVRAAIDVLAALPAPRLLVLGDMGEVGEQGEALHAEVGRYARAQGIEQLLALGSLSRATSSAFGGTHCEDMEALIAATLRALPAAGSALVKGSRFMRMERVVEAAIAAYANQETSPCC